MKNKRNAISKIDRLLEMPQEVYSDTPKITITGFNELIIENFKGILEYELKLENMTNDDIKVNGKVESIEIERKFDWGFSSYILSF